VKRWLKVGSAPRHPRARPASRHLCRTPCAGQPRAAPPLPVAALLRGAKRQSGFLAILTNRESKATKTEFDTGRNGTKRQVRILRICTHPCFAVISQFLQPRRLLATHRVDPFVSLREGAGERAVAIRGVTL